MGGGSAPWNRSNSQRRIRFQHKEERPIEFRDGIRGLSAVRPLVGDDLGVRDVAAAHYGDDDFAPDPRAIEQSNEVVDAGHRRSIQREDHVSGDETRLLGRSSLNDLDDPDGRALAQAGLMAHALGEHIQGAMQADADLSVALLRAVASGKASPAHEQTFAWLLQRAQFVPQVLMNDPDIQPWARDMLQCEAHCRAAV